MNYLTAGEDLDSLALEDILHERGHNHSKADYYPSHLFLRILCHALDFPDRYDDEQSQEGDHDTRPEGKRTSSYNKAEHGESLPPHSGHVDALLSDAGSTKSSTSTQALNKLEAQGESSDEPEREAREFGETMRKPFFLGEESAEKALGEQIVRLRELKKEMRVEVRKEPWFIFLLRNGTVISIHPALCDYAAPIKERLNHFDSVLRTSDDPSLLVESLVDLVVDRILEVMDEYQVKINNLERDILISPSMDAVRSLHVISGDLIMHKRTLDPIKTMIFGLALAKREQQSRQEKKEHAKNKRKGKHNQQHQQHQQTEEHPRSGSPTQNMDAQSAQPLSGHPASQHGFGTVPPVPQVHTPGEHVMERHGSDGLLKNDDQHMRAMAMGHVPLTVNGYFSYKSKVFLRLHVKADVYDHMDFALSSLDMFAATTENLINYAFNIASYDMNIVMNRLTLVTIIFLPLTLLTGYFVPVMNFEPFWSVEKNSDVLYVLTPLKIAPKRLTTASSFWKLAAPMMAVLIPLFMISDIKQTIKSWKRRRDDYAAVNELKVGLEAAGWKLVDERRGRR
ncbi:hypothetical protein FA13DRAFT_1790699 [Coprinellus micaceus]|uniref:Cora-domain-containing protein n=1 Tax=Coprinellus micaceus TaxID=71717 RepID=A0A4Y7TDY0_COPMI|nr:hypothetical protein FA13DRAFT_1790699 [Coprinellus micaceus]